MSAGTRPSVPFQPQLDVAWERRSRAFLTNLSAALGPQPHPVTGRVLFYDFWTGKWSPGRAFVASILVHVAILVFPIPSFRYARAAEVQREQEHVQLTYFGPARDLPMLAPTTPQPRGATKRPAPALAGRPTMINPRQTIVSTPIRPNHPRQTLIQPQAPPTPPKILPPLPNIVQWSAPAAPARPRPMITPLDVRRARRTRAQRPTEDLPLPQVPNSEIRAGELNIASSPPLARPRLPMQPISVPKAGERRAGTDAGPAPEIAGAPEMGNGSGSGLQNVIALSPNPAPPAPDLEIPLGNLSARFSTGPALQPGAGEGIGTGAGTGSGNGAASGSGTGGEGAGGGSGPPGVAISAGNPNNTASVAGPPSSSAPLPSRPLPARPVPRSSLRMPGITPGSSARDSAPLGPGYSGSAPDVVEPAFGLKRTYTLHINMPNLTSASGSWILRFAELNPDAQNPGIDVTAPVPIRKVDPRYPPVLIEQRIEGQVRLYAIIRANGSVDSIEVQRSLHPDLDRYSVEALAQWKFRPAGRHGKPVDVEAVITIPFRLQIAP